MKVAVLGVAPGPVVNEPVARQMALGAARLLDAEAVVAVTGAAGPDPLDGAPPGTVVIGVCVGGVVTARTHHFEGDPTAVCEQACDEAIASLRGALVRHHERPRDAP